MDYETRRYIEELTDAIRRAYNIPIPVSDIDSIISMMGGTIVEEELYICIGEGTVSRTEKGFSIKIEKSLSENKKFRNFRIATELGHLFLHMGFRVDNDLWNNRELNKYYYFSRSNAYDQAVYFAECLLMPKDEYIDTLDFYTENRSVDTLKVADYFNMPVSRVTRYGYILGYLKL